MSSDDDSERRPSFVGRVLHQCGWLMLLTMYVAVIPAGFFKDDFQSTGGADAILAWIVIVVRNYAFHVGLLMAVVAGLALLFRRLALTLCTVPLLILCLGQELRDFRDKPTVATTGETLTVMTFNLFDNNPQFAESGSAADVMAEIEHASPDVLFLQEYTERWHAALHEKLKATLPHYRAVPRDDPFGMAIYSRRPFCDAPQSKQDRMFYLAKFDAPQLRAAVKLGDRPVALYNLHLYPPVRLDCATANRRQFADLLNWLSRESLPAIIAGDFNFTQRSPQGKALEEAGLIDAHLQAGRGRGGTWSRSTAQWLPRLRYDHVYLYNGLASVECRTGNAAGSDHLPVIAKIGFEAANLSPEQQAQAAQKLSPELRAFFDLYKKINVGMSEQEVDSLLKGYPSKIQKVEKTEDSQSAFCKWYDNKQQATEGDYGIIVEFDDKHVVVGKLISEYYK